MGDFSFSTNKRQAEDMGGGFCPGKAPWHPARLQCEIIKSCNTEGFIAKYICEEYILSKEGEL